MTKEELSKFAGKHVLALVTRGGGMYRTIYKITEYEITSSGACKYIRDRMKLVANKEQCAYAAEHYPCCAVGRPTSELITKEMIF